MPNQDSFFKKQEESNLSIILEKYHFDTTEKQLDFIRLLFLAGCFDSEKFSDDLKASQYSNMQIEILAQVITEANIDNSAKKDLINFKPEIILKKFGTGKDWLEAAHNWLIKITQREFFARKPNQERWQQETGKWMQTYEVDIKTIVDRLGFEHQIAPKRNDYAALAVFGSTFPEMKKRITYVKHLIEKKEINVVPVIYLLCGERSADKEVDGQEAVTKIANAKNISPEQVTETHLMQAAYAEIKGDSLFSTIPFAIIDTPKGNKPRPTTVDTLQYLAATYSRLAGNLLFISRAPNIQAQAEDVYTVIQEKLPKVCSEIVGDACQNVTLNRILGAVGGALYAGYARVALELGSKRDRQELVSKCQNYAFTESNQASRQVIKNTM